METTRFVFLLSLLILGVLSDANSDDKRGRRFHRIRNPKDPHIVEVAKFAVREHNKNTTAKLGFVKVDGGEEQVFDSIKYKLNITARNPEIPVRNCGRDDLYEAIVQEKPWDNYRRLESFKKLEKKKEGINCKV